MRKINPPRIERIERIQEDLAALRQTVIRANKCSLLSITDLNRSAMELEGNFKKFILCDKAKDQNHRFNFCLKNFQSVTLLLKTEQTLHKNGGAILYLTKNA